jgi:hypothetical protein
MKIRAIVSLLLLVLVSTSSAEIKRPVADVTFLGGYLSKRGSSEKPEFWLTSHPRGLDARGRAGEQEVRLIDGSYPWKLASIFEQYKSIFPVSITGVKLADGSVALSTLDVQVPYQPSPREVLSVALEGKILKIRVKLNPYIKKENCLVRMGGILTTYPSSTMVWVELPDPYTMVGPGEDKVEEFEMDLGAHIPPGFDNVYVHVKNGRCGESHTVHYVTEK